MAWDKENGIDSDHDSLCKVSGEGFDNTSKWTLQRLTDTVSNEPQILLANVEEIIGCFKLKSSVHDNFNKD